MSLPSLFDQLQQLVALPSVSSHSANWDMGNRNVIDTLAGWLEDLGFKTEISPVVDNGVELKNKANLIATLGEGSGGLVLAGHTDTVPFDDDRWKTDPFKLTETDNKWYGLGATDMKGFFPVAIEAAQAFAQAEFKQPLIILATADEESSMSGARALAESGKPKARYAVIGEPTGMVPIRMHKGIMMEQVTVRGQSGHSSDPSLGHNAMESMHVVISDLLEFRREIQAKYQHSSFTVPTPTMNLGCIHGGDNPNRICGHCEMQFDLRALPGMDNQELRGQIDERLKTISLQLDTTVERKTLFGGVPAFEEASNSELVKAAEKLTGQAAESVAFATEAPFLQQLGMETIVMGPGSIDQAHQPDEFIATEQIQPAIDTLKALIRKFCL
jgi:acetylornithine deacetylase